MSDRRRTRILAHKEATLKGQAGTLRAVIDNVSLKGCLIKAETEMDLPAGSEAELTIHLEEGNPEFDIPITGTVVRNEESVIAFDFQEMSPESFRHLMKLVQYNADNPEDIEKELTTSAYVKV